MVLDEMVVPVGDCSSATEEAIIPLYELGGTVFNAMVKAGYIGQEGEPLIDFESHFDIFPQDNGMYQLKFRFARKNKPAA